MRDDGENSLLAVEVGGKDIQSRITRLRAFSTRPDIELRINDNRRITTDQRKKTYATMADMADYLGYDTEQLKGLMKYEYIAKTGEPYFSLSNCSVTTAREFLSFLIDFSLEWEIPLKEPYFNRTDDIDRYLYMCLKTRTCAISGERGADIHHCTGSVVGMGRDRRRMDNVGAKLIALSRKWHTIVHQQGEKKIFDQYKIYGISLDRQALKELKIPTYEEEL